MVSMGRIQPIIGLIVMIGAVYLFSANRRAIRWRVVAWGLGLQLLFALCVLKTDAGHWFFGKVNDGFVKIMEASDTGAEFVFGKMALPVVIPDPARDGQSIPDGQRMVQLGGYFALRVLPTIVFFSALMAIGYHLGVMQWIVRGFARVMSFSMKTSGAETMAAAGNIFVGQTEAPLMVRPYLLGMTRSELMAVMVGGFANTAGGVLLAYMGMLKDLVPNIGAHLLTSSIMTAPTSLMFAKLALPESGQPGTAGDARIELPRIDANTLDAATRGTTEGLTLALNVGAMLIVFIALVALANMMLGFASVQLGANTPWTLQMIFGRLFLPLAWLMGIHPDECIFVGQLLGEKTFLNEFIAYASLAATQGEPVLSPRSYIITSYALCGFANISSIGIQVGGIGAMAPERRKDLAQLGIQAMILGSLATFSAACIVAILTPETGPP